MFFSLYTVQLMYLYIYIYIYIYTPHPILPTPPFLNPLSHHLPPSTSTALSVVLFLWQNGCNEIMDLHMSSLGTLVPEGPWCLFYATLSRLLKSDTKYGCLLVPWLSITHTHIHTHKHTHTQTRTTQRHTQGPVDWHTCINIYLHHLLCAHSSHLYCIEWIIHLYKKFTFHNLFSSQKIFTCQSHISVNYTL